MDEPVVAGEHEFFMSVSMGIAVYPADGMSLNEILKNADVAMYKAKHEGRNTFRFYQRAMNTLALSRLHLETKLRHALQKQEFLLYYQPQINLESGQIVAVEALVRWQSENGMVAPEDFIPMAEESGLIVPIGEWVLETACRQAVAWNKTAKNPIKVAVNLSARQFRQQDIVQMISDTLHRTGCNPAWLELEITESVTMERPEESAVALSNLTKMGLAVAIDDFGTGYSSLAYLKRFPIQSLKIDRSFVLDIANDVDDASLVRAIIALAHSMNLQVVAEGVEDESQLSFLRTQDCDLVQGYYFYRPQTAGDISRYIETRG
jgi:EAL domain-containing protein (putative c-di-GMP-specific phosphodiesterase class I)